jgi:hypothetical protein
VVERSLVSGFKGKRGGRPLVSFRGRKDERPGAEGESE